MVHGIVYNEDTWGSSWAYVLVNRNLHFPYSCFAKWESLRDVDTYSRYWYIAHGYVSDITSDCVLIAGHIYLQFYQHFTVILSTEKTLNFTRCLFGCGPRYDKQIFGKDGMCLASCTIKSVYLTWLAKTHRPYFLMLLTWKLEHGADGQRTLVAWGAYIIILMKYCVYNRKYVVHGVKKFTANTNRSLYYKQTVFANSGEPSSTARALDAHNTYHSRYHNSIESGTIVLLNAGPARPQWRFTQVVSARSDKTRKCLYYFMNKCTSSQYKAYIAGCVLSDLYEAAAKLAMVTVLALDQNKRRYGHVAYSAFIAQQKIRKSYAPAIRGKLFPIQKLSTVDSRSK